MHWRSGCHPGLHCFEFDQKDILHQQIADKLADSLAVIEDFYRMLLRDLQPTFTKFVGKGVLVNPFKKPSAKPLLTAKAAPMTVRSGC